MDEKLLVIINEILTDKGESKIDALADSVSLRNDLGFDSMDLAVLTAKLDEECGIDIFENGIVDKIEDIKRKLG